MISMNRNMTMAMQEIARADKLPSDLADLVNQGFLTRDGCVFLSGLAGRQTNASADDFPDKTGYECFVNSIHIDDYAESNYLACACLFVEACFAEWRRTGSREVIKAVVSADEFGAVVKIHVARSGESWVSEDIEKYDDALLVADSDSAALR